MTDPEDELLSAQDQYALVRDSFLHLMLEQFKGANQYATKETLVVKCFKTICHGLGIDWASLVESNRNTFDLDDEVLREIQACWETKTQAQSLTAEEQITYERIMSRDYARHADMSKLILYMSRRCDVKRLHRLLAVDGFSGPELKKYIDYLKFPKNDIKARYVEFVRRMYSRLESPELVTELLQIIFQRPYDGDRFQRILYDEEDSVDDRKHVAYWIQELTWLFKPDELETLFKWKDQQWTDVQQAVQQPQGTEPNEIAEQVKGNKRVKRKRHHSGSREVVKRQEGGREASTDTAQQDSGRHCLSATDGVRSATEEVCGDEKKVSVRTPVAEKAKRGDMEPEESNTEDENEDGKFVVTYFKS